MSEFKGMKIYMAVEPQEDESFFIKKSTRDGSLAVFDEETNAVRQVKINDDSTELREGFIVSSERKKKIESQIGSLTAIATKHATRCDELHEALEMLLSKQYQYRPHNKAAGISHYLISEHDFNAVRKVLNKSRTEADK